jgi:hypothetical protein
MYILVPSRYNFFQRQEITLFRCIFMFEMYKVRNEWHFRFDTCMVLLILLRRILFKMSHHICHDLILPNFTILSIFGGAYKLWILSIGPCNFSQRLNLSSSLTDSVTRQTTNSTQLTLTNLLITSRHGPHRKHRSIIAVQLLPWKHACLPSSYLATVVV